MGSGGNFKLSDDGNSLEKESHMSGSVGNPVYLANQKFSGSAGSARVNAILNSVRVGNNKRNHEFDHSIGGTTLEEAFNIGQKPQISATVAKKKVEKR